MSDKYKHLFPLADDFGYSPEKTNTLRLLYEASQRLNQTLNLEEVYKTVTEFVRRIIPCDGLFISAFDPHTKLITCNAAWNGLIKLNTTVFPPIPLEPEGKGTQSVVIRTGESRILNDYQSVFRTATKRHFVNPKGEVVDELPDGEDYPRSALLVPLKVEGNVIGLVQVYSYRKNCYTEEHVQLMESLALHIASANHNALLYHQSQQNLAEKIKTEEALRNSQQLFATVTNTSPALIWMSGLDKGCTWFNEPRLAFTGSMMEDQIGDGWTGSVHPADVHRTKRIYSQSFDAKVPFVMEYRLRRHDGEFRWIIDRGHPRYDAGGKFVGYIGSCMDISEIKTLEGKLQEREATLQAITDSAQDGILMINNDGKISFWNPAASRILGYEAEDAIGKTFDQFFLPSRFSEQLGLTVTELLSTGKGAMSGKTIQTKAKRQDGTEVDIELSLAPVLLQGVYHLTGIMRDISERLLLQLQVEQAVKMETIGRLAGGVAHDFNNLLTVISGHGDMIQAQLGPQDPLNDHMKEIMLAASRASELTRQLLAFSRKQVLEPKVINLNATLNNMVKMLRRIIGEDITLSTALEPKLWNIKADPGQVEQVIANLSTNARDAMSSGGTLIIETCNEVLDETFCRFHASVVPGEYVRIAISDNGIGMSPEIRDKIFEPFYTTKEVGKGTGLGLAMVYGIIKQSGGTIDVYTELGIGTTFKIYFPRVYEDAEYLPEVSQFRRSEEYKGKATILVVEDEEIVREMTVKLLRQYGYTVIAAMTGGDALLVCEELKVPVDLVLTDVVMPNMNGSQFVERLRRMWPDVKVLFMSGYTANVIAQQGILDPRTPFIQKPFRMLELLKRIKEMTSTEISNHSGYYSNN